MVFWIGEPGVDTIGGKYPDGESVTGLGGVEPRVGWGLGDGDGDITGGKYTASGVPEVMPMLVWEPPVEEIIGAGLYAGLVDPGPDGILTVTPVATPPLDTGGKYFGAFVVAAIGLWLVPGPTVGAGVL